MYIGKPLDALMLLTVHHVPAFAYESLRFYYPEGYLSKRQPNYYGFLTRTNRVPFL